MKIKVLIITGALFALLSPIYAQQQSGGISGTINSETDAPLPGVTVELKSTHGRWSTHTDSRGRFHFTGLEAGRYNLRFSRQGLQQKVYSNLALLQGKNLQLQVTLEPGSFDETVTIADAPPLIDLQNAAVGDNLSPSDMRLLPTPRFLSDLAALAPGNVGGDTYHSSTQGASASASAYQVDGIDVSDPGTGRMWVYPNIESMREVQLKTVPGSQADTGGFTGLAINMVTNTGASEWNGGVSYYYFNDSMLQWNTDDPGLRRNLLRETFNSEVSTSVGGPIAGGTAWLYGNVGIRNRDVSFGNRTIPYRYRNTLWKGTFHLSESLSLNLMAHYSHFYRNGRGAAYNVAPEATHEQQGPNRSGAVDLRWQPDEATTVNFKAHGWDGFFTLEGRGEGPRFYESTTNYYFGNAAGDYKTDRDRYNAKLHVSHLTGSAGNNHQIKAGLEWQRGQQQTLFHHETIELIHGLPFYRTLYDPPGYTRNRVEGFTAFLQDSWQPSASLTLNGGVRMQRLEYVIPDQVLPGGDTLAGAGSIHSFTSYDPRFSVLWDPAGDGSTVVRASLGRYHETVLTYLLDEFTPGLGRKREFTWSPSGWQQVFSSPLSSPAVYSLADDLAPMYTDAVTLGVEHEALPGLSISADFIHRRDQQHVAAFEDRLRWLQVPLETQWGTYRVFSREGDEAHYTFQNSDALYSRYDALILRLNKRHSQRWQMMASLTLSRLYGNAEGKTGQTADVVTGELDYHRDPNNAIHAEGLLHAHRPWNFKLSTSYVLGRGVSLAAIIDAVAGGYWTPQLLLADPRLQQQRVTILAEPRGSRQLDPVMTVDVRLNKEFRLTTGTATLFVDVYNLFNNDGVTAVNVRQDSASFGRPVNMVQGRRFQAGFRVGF